MPLRDQNHDLGYSLAAAEEAAQSRGELDEAARESETRNRLLIGSWAQAVWETDADGVVVTDSPSWRAYTGQAPDEWLGYGWLDAIHPDDRAYAERHWRDAVAARSLVDAEFRLRAPDASWRWTNVRAAPVLDAAGRIEKWVGMNIDIDTRRQAELRLEERTADRNAIWQLSRDLMLRCSFDGVITAVNPAWTEVLGWGESELLGKSLFDLIHPDDVRHSLEGAAELSRGIGHVRFENRYRRRDGEYRDIAWTTRSGGGMISAVGRDVTSDKAQARTLRETEEALRQAQKMEAVGQLTGGLAHDFNNLLAVVTGSLELMERRVSQGRLTDLERYIRAANEATKRAAGLTHRLLAFSRRQTLNPQVTDVNTLLRGMDDLIRQTVGPAVEVECIAADNLWNVRVDANQLENALLNLCINARDAMPDGGRLTIRTANHRLDAQAAHEQQLSPGHYISLSVSDTGAGMPPAVVAKAFDPFFTTKPIGQGTGLGLSMIYGFALQSGGRARIASEPDKGTIVRIYLPQCLEDAAEVAMRAPSTPGKAQEGDTVLVVDDEAGLRTLVVEVLKELGYSACEAADGPTAMKLIHSGSRIDLLVTDVGLPGGMNGRQVADAARVARPELKVLFITGYAENTVVGSGQLDAGMAIVTKPFAFDVLVKAVEDLMSGP